jgi:adenylate kinase
MIVLLMGAPGAGKGTQADLLTDRLGFRKISTGDALRKHVKSCTAVGKQADAIMARGELVPDPILLEIVKEELGVNPKEVVILDGYPRNVNQAESLAGLETVHKVKACVHLDVSREELVARLSGRRVCSGCGASYHVQAAPSAKDGICDRCGAGLIQRPDDQRASISTRLEVYDKATEPVLGFYRNNDLYCRVDGRGEPSEIFGELVEVMKAVGVV